MGLFQQRARDKKRGQPDSTASHEKIVECAFKMCAVGFLLIHREAPPCSVSADRSSCS